jgi:hypothetical protein
MHRYSNGQIAKLHLNKIYFSERAIAHTVGHHHSDCTVLFSLGHPVFWEFLLFSVGTKLYMHTCVCVCVVCVYLCVPCFQNSQRTFTVPRILPDFSCLL